jgi:hypothetical protein
MNYPNQEQQKMFSASTHTGQVLGTCALPKNEAVLSNRPSTEIEECLSRANNALERLHNRISAVEDRLRPVMRATGSGQKGSAGAPTEALSPLGDAITGIEGRIESACDRLESLLLGLAL